MAQTRKRSSSRVWLITGCSSGFGRVFISSILARGDKVIATARNIDSLLEFEHNDVSLLQLDITASQDILNEKITSAIEIFGQIDVLINNAGYVLSGVWEKTRCVNIHDYGWVAYLRIDNTTCFIATLNYLTSSIPMSLALSI